MRTSECGEEAGYLWGGASGRTFGRAFGRTSGGALFRPDQVFFHNVFPPVIPGPLEHFLSLLRGSRGPPGKPFKNPSPLHPAHKRAPGRASSPPGTATLAPLHSRDLPDPQTGPDFVAQTRPGPANATPTNGASHPHPLSPPQKIGFLVFPLSPRHSSQSFPKSS